MAFRVLQGGPSIFRWASGSAVFVGTGIDVDHIDLDVSIPAFTVSVEHRVTKGNTVQFKASVYNALDEVIPTPVLNLRLVQGTQVATHPMIAGEDGVSTYLLDTGAWQKGIIRWSITGFAGTTNFTKDGYLNVIANLANVN